MRFALIKAAGGSLLRVTPAMWVSVVVCVVAGWVSPIPFLGGIAWLFIVIVSVFTLNFTWEALEDWRRLYKKAFDFSDFTATLTTPGASEYSTLVMRRGVPPRLLWVVVVNDHSSRVYMGWCFWSLKTPELGKAVTRGVRRKQVA
jgi:hypothetical protein